jgi:hypothetical protein
MAAMPPREQHPLDTVDDVEIMGHCGQGTSCALNDHEPATTGNVSGVPYCTSPPPWQRAQAPGSRLTRKRKMACLPHFG